MKILVSACLMGENCKYSGGNNRCQAVLDYVQGHQVITVCPEVMGGLPVPRIPCEIVDGVVINREGVSCDAEYHKGAREALAIAKAEVVDLAILKARSPSCGLRQIYDGTFSKKLVEGSGVFAGMMKEAGFRILEEGDLITGASEGSE